jgi:hypothetical protein
MNGENRFGCRFQAGGYWDIAVEWALESAETDFPTKGQNIDCFQTPKCCSGQMQWMVEKGKQNDFIRETSHSKKIWFWLLQMEGTSKVIHHNDSRVQTWCWVNVFPTRWEFSSECSSPTSRYYSTSGTNLTHWRHSSRNNMIRTRFVDLQRAIDAMSSEPDNLILHCLWDFAVSSLDVWMQFVSSNLSSCEDYKGRVFQMNLNENDIRFVSHWQGKWSGDRPWKWRLCGTFMCSTDSFSRCEQQVNATCQNDEQAAKCSSEGWMEIWWWNRPLEANISTKNQPIWLSQSCWQTKIGQTVCENEPDATTHHIEWEMLLNTGHIVSFWASRTGSPPSSWISCDNQS